MNAAMGAVLSALVASRRSAWVPTLHSRKGARRADQVSMVRRIGASASVLRAT